MNEQINKLKKLFSIENRTKYFVFVLLCLLMASIFIFTVLILGNQALQKNKKALIQEKTNAFADLNLEAKSVIVFDVVNHQEIFSKNPDESLPLASLTKILTAVVFSRKLKDNQMVRINEKYLYPEGDSGLVAGDEWKASDLRDFTLLTSSNDGACALAAITEKQNTSDYSSSTQASKETEFVTEMNKTALSLGLTNSKFFNAHGLDQEKNLGGAYGSARDMATLFEYVLKNYPDILEATRYKNLEFSSSEKTYEAENTNVYVNKIPNLIASKTGYTDLAGGNLIIAFDAGLNRPIIISVLGSTQEGRFTDTLKLVAATKKQLTNSNI
jgi:serine-type D-Ala-D-Ala carboxypeptidase (penicillin-binding protein 5/6)